MRDHATWSIGIGRWGGVPFRLHALFLLFAACTLYAAQKSATLSSGGVQAPTWPQVGSGTVASTPPFSRKDAAKFEAPSAENSNPEGIGQDSVNAKTTVGDGAQSADTTAADARVAKASPTDATAGNASPANHSATSISAPPKLPPPLPSESVVTPETQAAIWLATASLFVLYVSVLLHEVGHLFAAKQFGGGAEQIVLGPLGGLAPVRCPRDPRSEMLVHLAGPIVNLAVAWGICFPLLVLRGDGSRVLGLLDPLSPNYLVDPTATPWQSLVPLAFWINWCLVIVNLIPAYPFDGGQILRAVLTNWRPELGREVASLGVARLAKAGGIALIVMAWLVRGETNTGPVPSWFALLILAGCVYFSGRQQEQAIVAENGYWAPSEAWPPVGRLPAPTRRPRSAADEESEIATWGEGIREVEDESVEELIESEPDDDRRLDEVLARLHEVGLANLTEDERRVLERASARYRGRNSRTSS